jgi:hypothetical protein
MTDELDETCLEVMDISVRGWRVTEARVMEENAKELAEIVSTTDQARTTIVYQLYDNTSYMVKGQECCLRRGLMENTMLTAGWRWSTGRSSSGWSAPPSPS